MNSNPLDRVRKNKVPHCERHHAHLTPGQRAEAAAWFPVGHQAQMAFLLARHDNNTLLLATVLNTSARAVPRDASGALLPPGPRLRRAVWRWVLGLVCPGCVAYRVVEGAREAERDARRAGWCVGGTRTADR